MNLKNGEDEFKKQVLEKIIKDEQGLLVRNPFRKHSLLPNDPKNQGMSAAHKPEKKTPPKDKKPKLPKNAPHIIPSNDKPIEKKPEAPKKPVKAPPKKPVKTPPKKPVKPPAKKPVKAPPKKATKAPAKKTVEAPPKKKTPKKNDEPQLTNLSKNKPQKKPAAPKTPPKKIKPPATKSPIINPKKEEPVDNREILNKSHPHKIPEKKVAVKAKSDQIIKVKPMEKKPSLIKDPNETRKAEPIHIINRRPVDAYSKAIEEARQKIAKQIAALDAQKEAIKHEQQNLESLKTKFKFHAFNIDDKRTIVDLGNDDKRTIQDLGPEDKRTIVDLNTDKNTSEPTNEKHNARKRDVYQSIYNKENLHMTGQVKNIVGTDGFLSLPKEDELWELNLEQYSTRNKLKYLMSLNVDKELQNSFFKKLVSETHFKLCKISFSGFDSLNGYNTEKGMHKHGFKMPDLGRILSLHTKKSGELKAKRGQTMGAADSSSKINLFGFLTFVLISFLQL